MAGIYVHVPFCKRACHYCNFHFSVSLKNKNDFIAALLKEISLQQNYLQQEAVDTIYFGGGTPSLLLPQELTAIMHALRANFSISHHAEITLEANPDDINSTQLMAWRQAGINRLSIGIQSFFEEDLQWMNRAHSAAQAAACIPLTRAAGFDNFSIDLIYGSPLLTDEKWQQNVATALALQLPHLSCYALTVEPQTALQKMIEQHKKEPVDPEKQARQFLLLMDWLQAAGYEHYEISNFALPGFRSRHNAAYWAGTKYLGLGPAAHSFDGKNRRWNIANNTLYYQSLLRGELPFEEESLTEVQQLNEYIMTSLRTVEGLDTNIVTSRFGPNAALKIENLSRKYMTSGKMEPVNGRLVLTADLFFAEGF